MQKQIKHINHFCICGIHLQLCQLMQNYHVFEPAKGPEDGKGQFDDSNAKFYKFLDDKCDTDDTSSSSSKLR